MAKVFISYRREDTASDANALYQTLRSRFGPDLLFKDVDDVRLGANFRRVIEDAIEKSTVVLALVGPSWKPERLARANDNVRLELEAALRMERIVIPVCVRGARMPSEADLPQGLEEFAYLNAAGLEHESWERDCQPLIDALVEIAQLEPAQGVTTREPDRPADQVSWTVESVESAGGELSILLVSEGGRHQVNFRRVSGWAGALGLGSKFALLLDGRILQEKVLYVAEQSFDFELVSGPTKTHAMIIGKVPTTGRTFARLLIGGVAAGSWRV
jgi:hypothetical protein